MEIIAEKTAIEQLLSSYQKALNASNVNGVLSLYTDDGIFMPSNTPSSIECQRLFQYRHKKQFWP